MPLCHFGRRNSVKDLHQENIKTLASKIDIQDVRVEISELRAEMRQEFAAVRAEISELRSETKQEFAAVRSETQQEFVSVRTEISKLHLEMGNMKHDILKWIIGLLMAQSALLISGLGIGIAYMDKIP